METPLEIANRFKDVMKYAEILISDGITVMCDDLNKAIAIAENEKDADNISYYKRNFVGNHGHDDTEINKVIETLLKSSITEYKWHNIHSFRDSRGLRFQGLFYYDVTGDIAPCPLEVLKAARNYNLIGYTAKAQGYTIWFDNAELVFI